MSAYDPKRKLDVWPYLHFWTAVRGIANCGWSRYAALSV
jgi:hypothetical protein